LTACPLLRKGEPFAHPRFQFNESVQLRLFLEKRLRGALQGNRYQVPDPARRTVVIRNDQLEWAGFSERLAVASVGDQHMTLMKAGIDFGKGKGDGGSLGHSKFEMSLTVGQHGVAMVGRIDKSSTNRLFGDSIDHRSVNNCRWVVRLKFLAESWLGQDAVTRNQDDQDQADLTSPGPALRAE